MEKLILLVDDDPLVLSILTQCLRPHYPVRIATLGLKGLELARLQPLPDLILLDVQLPDLHGYDICRALKQDALTREIPLIFLTSHADVDNVTQGFELGAVDYVSKPVAPPVLLARVKTHLRLREAGEFLRDQNLHLESLVNERTRDLQARTVELQLSQDLAIVALGSIAETRDNETGNHIHRTRAYVKIICERLASLPRYQGTLTAEQWAMIWKSAPLHDIGKVGIPDHILLKPGKLSAAEFQMMQCHPVIGRDAIQTAETRMNSDGSFLGVAKEIAYSHHERWDGTGYPDGLGAEAIPLAGRIMALADVYDALISRRVYKPALPHAQAVEIIRDGRGSHFDPLLVDCFLEDAAAFHVVASRYSDDNREDGSHE